MSNALIAQLAGLILLSSTSWTQFQINTRTPYGQTYPDVAIDGADEYVVVWRSYRQDGSSGGVYCQRLDAVGQPLGEEFQVNVTTGGDQSEPAVSADAEGRFVVVWHGPGPNELDVFARLFDPNAEPLSDELRVNATTEGTQRYPRVAMYGDGSFVVVWQNEAAGENQYDRAGSLQVFDAQGLPIGQETQFSGPLDCRHPDVATNSTRGFAVTWMQDKGGNSIRVRLYDDSGTPVADPCKVNDVAFTSVTRPRIAMNHTGMFAIAWDGHGQYASQDDIHARTFDPNGKPTGNQFLVNTTAEGKQESPRVSISDDDAFVVVWHGDSGHSGHKKDVFGQRLDGLGNRVGWEFCPHICMAEDQKHAAVAMSETGSFLTVWQSYKQDGSDYGVFGMLGPSTCQSDFTGDDFVNFRDLAIMTRAWQAEDRTSVCDLNGDGRIDMADVEMLCSHWLRH